MRLLSTVRSEIKSVLGSLPFVCQSFQHQLMVEATTFCWAKTPFAEAVLSPSCVPVARLGRCQCSRYLPNLPRRNGHIVTRNWDQVSCCRQLAAFGSSYSFQCRTYPPVEKICQEFQLRVKRYFRMAGFSEEVLEEAVSKVMMSIRGPLEQWHGTLPAVMNRSSLAQARKSAWNGGIVLCRVDRNPGRLIAVCRDVWVEFQNRTFLQNSRYVKLDIAASGADVSYASSVPNSFIAEAGSCEAWIGRKPPGRRCRPQSYWTIKQKSLISSAEVVLLKIRPLNVHSCHPLRTALPRVARALSILVCDARILVLERRPLHLPMWQLHAGCKEWLTRVAETCGSWGCDEYDVNQLLFEHPKGRSNGFYTVLA